MKQSDFDSELATEYGLCVADPARFIRFNYPWSSPGALERWDGPDWWHLEVCEAISEYLRGPRTQPLQIAVASGHGTGKTTFIAWVIDWFMSCFTHPQVVVTANTESQLNTRTWRELAKWNKLALNAHWFEWTATQFYLKQHPETWRANAIPWSENNSEAFAGTHEDNVLVVYDEASKISDRIWEVTDGVMTTKGAIWLAFGNPTRNVGRFYECFHGSQSKYWRTWNIDSRTCKAANKDYMQRLVEQYGGEEDDRSKYRVRGLFPATAVRQLISKDAVDRAMKTEVETWEFAPKVMGVDIARYGDNQSEIAIRQGRKVLPILRVPKGDLMSQAGFIAEQIRKERPAVVCVDGSGIGAGVVDRLRQLNFSIVDVNGGNSSINPRFLNKRAEMWWAMKEWIETGECELPPDAELSRHLTVVEYDYTDKGRVRLERKEDIISEFGFSPDKADAVSLTFAYPVLDDVPVDEYDPPIYEDS